VHVGVQIQRESKKSEWQSAREWFCLGISRHDDFCLGRSHDATHDATHDGHMMQHMMGHMMQLVASCVGFWMVRQKKIYRSLDRTYCSFDGI